MIRPCWHEACLFRCLWIYHSKFGFFFNLLSSIDKIDFYLERIYLFLWHGASWNEMLLKFKDQISHLDFCSHHPANDLQIARRRKWEKKVVALDDWQKIQFIAFHRTHLDLGMKATEEMKLIYEYWEQEQIEGMRKWVDDMHDWRSTSM